MILAVDVGNSNIKIGAFAGDRLVRQWRIETDLRRSAASYAKEFAGLRVGRRLIPKAVVFGSVVPGLDAVLRRAIRSAFGGEPAAVHSGSRLGLRLRVPHPAQVGADRILNALAMRELIGGPAVAIDFGTATTVDCIDAAGDFIGGAILIGPKTAARALHEFTAKLPFVPIRKPRRAIGKTTIESLRTGQYYGYLGMIREILQRTRRELGAATPAVLTGGAAKPFLGDLPNARYLPALTLHGLRIAYEILHHE